MQGTDLRCILYVDQSGENPRYIRMLMLERLKSLPSDGRDDAGGTESLTQTALRMLQNDIICGKLKPGARLRLVKLKGLYGIGASPLREALSRLVPSGFVVSLERRGFVVAPISLRDFRELTDVRKLIEKEAVRLSLADGDVAWEGRVVAALHRLSKLSSAAGGKMSQAQKDWENVNEEFQEALVSGCTSLWLLNFRRTAYFYAKRYLRVCLSATEMRDVQKDQRAMADAAVARDVAKLQSLTENGLERAYRKVAASGKVS